MFTNRKFSQLPSMLLVALLSLSVPFTAFAANCNKKPDHPDCADPPPDDGGNDTADPDWAILAVDGGFGASFTAESDCLAFNPDRKGPGIAYVGFYDNDGYITCAQTTTSDNTTVIDLKLLEVKTDGDGTFTTILLRGRNPDDGTVYESDTVSFANSGCDAPTSEVAFTLQVRATIDMFSCGTAKTNRKTVCDTFAGNISLGDLVYCPVGDSCASPPGVNCP